jgi:hypothetical protein
LPSDHDTTADPRRQRHGHVRQGSALWSHERSGRTRP